MSTAEDEAVVAEEWVREGERLRSSPPTIPFKPAAGITPSNVHWLWPGYIPYGCITLLAGEPGQGKSTVALDIAARVTTGREMPDATRSMPRVGPRPVVFVTSEDIIDKTLLPRFLLAGGDQSQLYYEDDLFSMQRGEQRLRSLPQGSLIVFDPLEEFCGSSNTNNSTQVRHALGYLRRALQEAEAACIGIIHLNKNEERQSPLARITGSGAFGATARLALMVGGDPNSPPDSEGNPSLRGLAWVKGNLDKVPPTLNYHIEAREGWAGTLRYENSVIVWDGTSKTSAHEMIRGIGMSIGNAAPSLEIAKSWLSDWLLMDGPLPAAECHERAEKAGVSQRTLARAKKELGVQSEKRPDGWYWKFAE